MPHGAVARVSCYWTQLEWGFFAAGGIERWWKGDWGRSSGAREEFGDGGTISSTLFASRRFR
jgi:hypothetical protein